MRPTTRRVTAQRKFAQGAFIPPVLAASSASMSTAVNSVSLLVNNNITERRDAPPPTNDKSNIIIQDVPIRNFLDLICFSPKDSNNPHYKRPVVLLERLQRGSDNNHDLTVTVKSIKRATPKKPKKISARSIGVNKKVHMMNLRSSMERHIHVKYSPPPSRKRKLPRKPPDKPPDNAKRRCVRPIGRPPKRSASRKADRLAARRAARPAARPTNYTIDHSAIGPQNLTEPPSGEFTLDDNKPLTFFANGNNTSTPKAIPPPSSVSSSANQPLATLREMWKQPKTPERLETVYQSRTVTPSESSDQIIVVDSPVPMLKRVPLKSRSARSKAARLRQNSEQLEPAEMTILSSSIDEFARLHQIERDIDLQIAKTSMETDEPRKPMKRPVEEYVNVTDTDTDIEIMPKRICDSEYVRRYMDEVEAGPSGLCGQKRRERQKGTAQGAAEVLVVEPQPGPSKERPKEVSSDPNYYSELGIQRWIDGSLIGDTDSANKRQGRPTESNARQNSEDEDFTLGWDDDSTKCPAKAWVTLKEVTDAPKSVFDSRCKICKPCERIDKIMKLSSLLKRQMKIDCRDDNSRENTDKCNPNPTQLDERPDESGRFFSSDGDKHLHLEMIPRSEHLITKVKLHNVQGNQTLSACFAQRSDHTNCKELGLSEHEHLLSELVQTITRSLDHSLSEARTEPRKEASREPSPRMPSPAPTPVTISDTQDERKDETTDEPAESSTSKDSKQKAKEKDKGKHKDKGTFDAPVFWPTHDEFQDPMAYINKIWPLVANYGICKIVPPEGFVPPCKADDDIRFEVCNQYISRLYSRWGAAAREFCAIKMCLKAQNISYARPPLLEGVEVNLPKLYHLVHRHGGLEAVINKKKWGKVAEDMNLVKNPFIERKLDHIYAKYLLPYAALSNEERQEYLRRVEVSWSKKHAKLLQRANNPLHRCKRLLYETDSSGDDNEEDETDDAEDCVKPGISMNLAKFKKVARSAYNNFFRGKTVTTAQVEQAYWRLMLTGTEHICVNSASVDTGEQGLGFTKNTHEIYSRHPWNLKMLSQHEQNVLRTMGAVLGVTVPTLHLGMLFSTSCWHRDPHALPWMEYLHHGSDKIWYGIAEKDGMIFRGALEFVSPTSCQNKSLWLSSDIAMVPPELLRKRSVKMCRVEQSQGEFVLVMPRAYSCSISTGFCISESTYFATEPWLNTVKDVFADIRNSCEPTMFAIPQIIKAIAEDPRSTRSMLEKIKPILADIIDTELKQRDILFARGLRGEGDCPTEYLAKGKRKVKPPVPAVWNVREEDECEVCRCTLYLSKVRNIPSRTSTVCMEHALKLLDKKVTHPPVSEIIIEVCVSAEDLKETVRNLDRRLGHEEL